MNRFTALVSMALVAAFAQSAHARDVIYDNNAGGAGGINGAILSDLDNSSGGLFRINADDVTLAEDGAIAGIEWTGVYAHDLTPPLFDNFTIEIYADFGGFMPLGGPPMHSFHVGNAVSRFDSGFDRPSGADIFNYSTPISFTLPANTTVWVAVFNNTAGENDDFFWGMLWPASPQGNAYFSANEGNSWSPTPYRHDFRLIGGDTTGVVTFENLVIDRLDLAGPQTEGGFTYEAVTGEGWELVSAFGDPPSSLATYFNSEEPSSFVGDTVEIHADGQLFTFNSVDYRALSAGIPAVVQISGFRDGAFIDVLPLDFPSTTAFETAVSGFTEQVDLLKVRLTSVGTSALFLDNFDVTLVPPGVAITFENHVIDRLDLAGPKTEGEFTYEALIGEGWELVSQFGNPPSSLATAFNDESANAGDRVEIHAGGQLFSFTSVDYRSLVGGIPDQVQVAGFRNGDLRFTVPLNNPSTIGFQTQSSPTNEAIDMLRVSVTSSNSAAVFLDNFVLAFSSCPADLNNDGAVGFSDLLDVLAAWGECGACPADIDGDGFVGFSDLLAMLGAWGPCDV